MRAVERRRPNLIVLEVSEHAPRGEGRKVTFRNLDRLAALQRGGPEGDLRLLRARRRVGGELAFGWPVGVMVAAADVDEPAAVWAERQAGDLLAVVLRVACQRPGREAGAVRDPDVAHAVYVLHPGDAVRVLGGDQVADEGEAQELRQAGRRRPHGVARHRRHGGQHRHQSLPPRHAQAPAQGPSTGVDVATCQTMRPRPR